MQGYQNFLSIAWLYVWIRDGVHPGSIECSLRRVHKDRRVYRFLRLCLGVGSIGFFNQTSSSLSYPCMEREKDVNDGPCPYRIERISSGARIKQCDNQNSHQKGYMGNEMVGAMFD